MLISDGWYRQLEPISALTDHLIEWTFALYFEEWGSHGSLRSPSGPSARGEIQKRLKQLIPEKQLSHLRMAR
jgi:hypothetical protein